MLGGGGSGIGLLNPALLWGLSALAVPLLLHLWRRRRRLVVDWGAMMFLDDGEAAPPQRAPRVNDRLLLAVRMGLLALLAVGLARPFWGARASNPATTDETPRRSSSGRTYVLAIDGSASMEERRDGIAPRTLALRWARRWIAAMRPEDSAALIDAGARSRIRIAPPTRDKGALGQALSTLENAGGGPSDLPDALDQALRILADSPDVAGDVILLTDGQRFPWRPEETLRWELVRELHERLDPNAPRIWAVSFGVPTEGASREESASLGSLNLGRSQALSGQPIVVSAMVANHGAGPIAPSGQLIVDGRLVGPPIKVGPISPGSQTRLEFSTTLATPGMHLLRVELIDDDASPGDNAAEGLVEVIERLPVLIVDGKPGDEPLGGQADFLKVALDPGAVDREEKGVSEASAAPFQARVVTVDQFAGGQGLNGPNAPRVLVLADVGDLNAAASAAVDRFVSAGGGLMVVPGDQAQPNFRDGREWFPGKLDPAIVTAPTRLDLSSFSGLALGRFAAPGAAGEGGVPLSQVEIFRHRMLTPGPGTEVTAKLASGAPWCVERPYGKGRVLVVTTALDGRATTLPINPDFVPLAHEWVLSLAKGSAASQPKRLQSGEPWIVSLDPRPASNASSLPLRRPGDETVVIPVSPNQEELRIDDIDAPGVYRLGLERPAYAIVEPDARESDRTPLSREDLAELSRGWPLSFETGDRGLIERIQTAESQTEEGSASPRFEFWRFLVLAALVGLCLESWLTRRLSGV
ncbi:MAG: hypothetical protein ABS79_03110 [Planctomycetes bacterium SCN 63-9]|nr:MAG: hypothetical protein ABS79_03110 [Planctomycetes bacterium SCN 63-9]